MLIDSNQAITELHALSTKASAAALLFIEDLDKLIGVYHHPAGSIAVNGAKDGKLVYKVFKEL